jgi:YbbR domain-containing protein
MQISLVTVGDPAVGYLAEDPVLETNQVTVTGPASQVNLVQEVRATLDINQAYDNINRTINLLALDASENVIEDVNLSPERITVEQDINQRYGYRNVVVTVQVEGQVADGYRLTNTSVFPPLVTVFSSDPQVVNELPGYVNTVPLNLSGLKDDVDISLPLNLPEGVSVVDDRTSVLVRLSVAAVQSSLPLANVPVEVIGLSPLLSAKLSPQSVTIILSGPLPLLDAINYDDIRVVIDMTDYEVGTYQLEPVVELVPGEITVESIQPEVINIEVIIAPTPTPGLP